MIKHQKHTFFRLETLIVFFVVFLALFLRVHKLDVVPPSLYWEEVALGYDAYSISQTGKDFHGNILPILAFPSFGDYKPSVYFYAIASIIRFVGLNAWSVRLPSAIAGTVTVLCVYLIGKEISSKKVGFFAALFCAIQPWAIQLSRVGFEINLATMFIALGVLFFLKAEKKISAFFPGILCFVLAMYTYHSARVVAPLLGGIFGLRILYLLWKQHQFSKKTVSVLFGGVLIAGLLCLPIIVNIKNPVIAQRMAETSIFSDVSMVKESNALREEDGYSLYGKILHHRFLIITRTLLDQYGKNFSLSFLFLTGDDNLRHSTQEFGMLYHWEFFAICIGLYVIVEKKQWKMFFLVLWIAIAGIPVAITVTSPHALRFALAYPVFALLSALGIVFCVENIKGLLKLLFAIVFITIVFGEFFVYRHFYMVHYPIFSANQWQYGYKELFQSLEKLKKSGQRVYVTREQGRPSMYYMFFTKQDPLFVQHQDNLVDKDQLEFLSLGNYHFVDGLPNEINALYASSPEKRPMNTYEKDRILLPDGKQVWSIWELNHD